MHITDAMQCSVYTQIELLRRKSTNKCGQKICICIGEEHTHGSLIGCSGGFEFYIRGRELSITFTSYLFKHWKITEGYFDYIVLSGTQGIPIYSRTIVDICQSVRTQFNGGELLDTFLNSLVT